MIIEYWSVATHLGSASLMLPVLVILAVGLGQGGEGVALGRWLGGFALAAGLTLTSKILFMGWGLGIPALDFTGISGHTLLASAVLPLLGGWIFKGDGRSWHRGAAALGFVLAALVGVSRVVLGAHSVSEVLAGFALGAAVSGLALGSLRGFARNPTIFMALPLVLLLALHSGASTYLPSHQFERALALSLSGRTVPYGRSDWAAAPR